MVRAAARGWVDGLLQQWVHWGVGLVSVLHAGPQPLWGKKKGTAQQALTLSLMAQSNCFT